MSSRLTIDGASQRAQRAGILARLRAAAPAVVKAAGFELAQVAVDRISGIGSIRRVDTTRYRGSIGAAAKEATGRDVVVHEVSESVAKFIRETDKLRGLAPDDSPAEPDKLTEGDYAGSVETWNFGASLRMATFVPYAGFLERGTASMRAGYHLANAKMQAKPHTIPAAAKVLSDALRGA